MSDRRRRILDRRAAFVAALTSLAATACEGARPCLSPMPVEPHQPEADAGPGPQPAADAEPPADAGK